MMSATSAKSSASKPRVATGGSADAQARGDGRRTGVEGNGVTVDGNTDLVQQILGLLTVELGVDQVNKDEVHVGAARDQLDTGPSSHRQHPGARQ